MFLSSSINQSVPAVTLGMDCQSSQRHLSFENNVTDDTITLGSDDYYDDEDGDGDDLVEYLQTTGSILALAQKMGF